MTILDIEGMMNKGDNCAQYSSIRNEGRNGFSAEQMKAIIDIYYTVTSSYIDIFNENWFEDNIEETNTRFQNVIKKNISKTYIGFPFKSQEDSLEIGRYVLTLPFPTDLDTMKVFFKEVLSGKLEFLCRYPIEDTDALSMIKSIDSLLGI